MSETAKGTLEDWSICFQTRYGQRHAKHWYPFDPVMVPGTKTGDGYLCEGLAERGERYPAALVPQEKWGVHEAHCCRRHGCTYENYEKCPVVAGAIDADGSCERCSEPAEMAKELVEELASFHLPEVEGVLFRTYVQRAREIKRLMEVHDAY